MYVTKCLSVDRQTGNEEMQFELTHMFTIK